MSGISETIDSFDSKNMKAQINVEGTIDNHIFLFIFKIAHYQTVGLLDIPITSEYLGLYG